MRRIDPRETKVKEVFDLLLGGVAPRPIALVSTLAEDGSRNLSPFSFFNAFGGNPPTVCFSPSRRQRDGSVKDTYNNLVATRECVIQAVTYNMVQQVSLASTEYPTGVDEFLKSGLTPLPSEKVKPFRVAESPFQMECVLTQMINFGHGPGSGNLAVCEVVLFHVAEDVFRDGIIQPGLIDLVGRNSGDYYTRASGAAVFSVKKPIQTKGIGYDQLPEFLKRSEFFSANNLGQFGNSEQIPSAEEVIAFIESIERIDGTEATVDRYAHRGDYKAMLNVAICLAHKKHPRAAYCTDHAAKVALENNDVLFAWHAVLYSEMIRQGLA